MRLSVQRTHVARGHAQSAVAYRAWRWGAVRASSMMKVITQRPSWKIATDPTSPPLAPALLPAPAHGAIVGHVGSRLPDRLYAAWFRPRPHGPGGPGQDRRAAAKMPFRSAIRLAYSLHMRCRDLLVDRYVRGPVTYAHRAAQPLRARCTEHSRLATVLMRRASRSRARPPDCGSTSDKPAPMPNTGPNIPSP